MVRVTDVVSAAAVFLLVTGDPLGAAQKAIYESEPKTVTATIEAIETSSRVVTLKTSAGNRLHVTAPEEMDGFTRLKLGDVVTATYFEAVVVRLVRPGSAAPSGTPTTMVRRKDDAPGSETRSERTVRATVTAVDVSGSSLTLRTAEGTERTMTVTDATQLAPLKVGDALDVTFYESRLVSVGRPQKEHR